MRLLIGDMVRNAAAAAPGNVACTLGDDEITFGAARRASRTESPTRCAECGVGHGDRVVVVGRHVARGDADVRRAGEAGRGVRTGERPAGRRTRRPTIVGYARPRLVVADDAHARRSSGVDVPNVYARPSCSARPATRSADAVTTPALDERDPHVIFFTSGSTGRPKGVVLSHRANCLRSFPGLGSPTATAGTVCMFPLFHMAGWRSRSALAAAPCRSTSCRHPMPRRCCARSSAGAPPAST